MASASAGQAATARRARRASPAGTGPGASTG